MSNAAQRQPGLFVIFAPSRAMDRRRFRAARSRSAVKVEELREVISSHPSPEALAIATQSGQSVTRGLAEVPQEQREALEPAFYRGFSHSKIAGHLGEPLGTVKTRIRAGGCQASWDLKDTVWSGQGADRHVMN
jgi:RNA polymerase sigma-70 factor (ECF subfamily)